VGQDGPKRRRSASNGTGGGWTEQDALLRVQGLKKVFRSGESDLVLFENLSFEVKRGEMLAIVGESGAGKSTLLHILSALDHASAGDVYCAQLKLNSLSADEAAEFRNREAGFVWQFHYLLPEFTAAENVAMPLLVRGRPGQRRRRKLHAGCVRSGWSNAGITARESFRAESNSGWLWRGRSLPVQSCCWRMSLPGTSTDRRRKRFSN
jgi:ABC-type glutathione transport system ATPase component